MKVINRILSATEKALDVWDRIQCDFKYAQIDMLNTKLDQRLRARLWHMRMLRRVDEKHFERKIRRAYNRQGKLKLWKGESNDQSVRFIWLDSPLTSQITVDLLRGLEERGGELVACSKLPNDYDPAVFDRVLAVILEEVRYTAARLEIVNREFSISNETIEANQTKTDQRLVAVSIQADRALVSVELMTEIAAGIRARFAGDCLDYFTCIDAPRYKLDYYGGCLNGLMGGLKSNQLIRRELFIPEKQKLMNVLVESILPLPINTSEVWLEQWNQLTQFIWMFPDVLVISRKPTTLSYDEEGRLSTDSGPPVRFSDGSIR